MRKPRLRWWLALFVAALAAATAAGQATPPCKVATGQSSIILDMEESRGNQLDQGTSPAELPIGGDPLQEVELGLVFPSGVQYFVLNGKRLQLVSPLDRDAGDLASIVFQVSCTVRATGQRRNVPIIVRVSDVNDNAPVFHDTPYVTSVPELTPVGNSVFRNVHAVDADSGVNGLVDYFTIPGDGSPSDGHGVFSINLPHQGIVTLNRSLDYERTQIYFLTIVASDRALNTSERFSTTTTLTINVLDSDDQDPSFVYSGCMVVNRACINAEYTATVQSGKALGVLDVYPERIRAVDMDSLNSPIRYSLLSGQPITYQDYFEIDPVSGALKQLRPVERNVASSFDLIVKAEELSDSGRFTTAKLHIIVQAIDSHPPVIEANSVQGYVDENAPVGTVVVSSKDTMAPLRLYIRDDDLAPGDPRPGYQYELTTPYFRIDQQGIVVVNQDHLDRDPPNPGSFHFQVVAREVGAGAASAPVSLTVHLKDVNDNMPEFVATKPVTMRAGDGRRRVVQVHASDNDAGDNARIEYTIHHVSNNGRDKFVINGTTGEIDSVGKLSAGEQYSITVVASDRGGMSSQNIIEVEVVPGPNLRPPVFKQQIYDAQVSEGAAIRSSVITITANDPEGDVVHYSITSGNDLLQFGIGDTSGVITVIRSLDREELSRYSLVIRTEDNGGLSSTATVNVRVTDINDKNPEFTGLPYLFHVSEGLANQLIGKVTATDADADQNGQVYYSVPTDSPVSIDRNTGEVRTRSALDYEKQKVHLVVVTARDGGPDPRIATATLTLSVDDLQDEPPVFRRTTYEANVPENVPDYLVVQVQADDADTTPKVTYVINQGPVDKFSIDRETGAIRTTQALDFEEENRYVLIVGTNENTGSMLGSTTTVLINVEDRNDIPPVFTEVPRPIRLQDTDSVGTTITSVIATDSDGTAPGNKVKYEVIGRGKAGRYFQIDADTGVIRIRDDLRKELDKEYQIIVRAYDLGEPQLASQTTVNVFVDHVATMPPDTGVGFAEQYYTVEVPENSVTGTVIKKLTVINKPSDLVPVECEIIAGNEDRLFAVVMDSKDRDCTMQLTTPKLDHEIRQRYNVSVRLNTLSGLVSPMKTITTINIRVLDVNDNRPEFMVPKRFQQLDKQHYLVAVPRDAQVDTTVLQVQATDKDTGRFGQLIYDLDPATNNMSYFSIDKNSGVIKTEKTFDGVDSDWLPFKLLVRVRDNPGDPKNSLTSEIPVVINLISDDHRMVLVISDTPPHQVKSHEDQMVEIMQDQAHLLVGVEKVAVAKFISENNSLETDSTSTNVWFYAIAPDRETILSRTDSLVQRNILSKNATTNIAYYISSNLGVRATEIHEPLKVVPVAPVAPVVKSGGDWDGFPATLVAIGAVIFFCGIAGVVYICLAWRRYKSRKERAARMIVVPKYEPVFVEPNLKEYETQVLQMSMAVDDNDSFNDLQLDFSTNKSHAFSLDNVSYITKDTAGDSIGKNSPVDSALSEAATTARVDSRAERTDSEREVVGNSRRHLLELEMEREELSPVRNPLYDRWGNALRCSDDEDEEGILNVSATNDNVMFKEKKDYCKMGFNYLNDSSPVEATTEL